MDYSKPHRFFADGVAAEVEDKPNAKADEIFLLLLQYLLFLEVVLNHDVTLQNVNFWINFVT